MALLAKRLGKALINATAVDTADTIVTNTSGVDTIITHIHLYNAHSVAVTVTLCQVDDSAGSVGTAASTDIFFVYSIPAGESIILGSADCKIVLLDTNDTLQAYASEADKVNIFAYGFTMTDQE
jgi:hypothetical protein